MSLKIIAILGWTFFTRNALAVLWLFVTKNVGDDPAGRGMATRFAVILGPIVLMIGAALSWAHRSGSIGGVALITLLLGIPFWLFAYSLAKNELANLRHARIS